MTDDPTARPSVASPEEPPAATPEDSTIAPQPGRPKRDEWAMVRKLARKQLDRFMSLEPKVLRGDNPKAIHDIRVASRRLQQILDLIYPKPRPGEVRNLRRRLKRARRCLSEVRNCDVLLLNAHRHVARKRTTRREVWLALEHFLLQRREASFAKAVRKLGKTNLPVFYVEMRDHLSLPVERPGTSRPAGSFPELTPEQFYERVGRSLERVWGRFESQLQLAHREPSAAVVHGARIATKRLRYLVEVIEAFDVAGSQQRLAWLRSLQTLLGDWHDLEVLEEMMIALVARPEFLREHLPLAMAVEKQIVRNRAHKQDYQKKFFSMTLDSPDLRGLGEWVAYLLESPSDAFATA